MFSCCHCITKLKLVVCTEADKGMVASSKTIVFYILCNKCEVLVKSLVGLRGQGRI